MKYFIKKNTKGYAILFSIIVTGIVLSLVLGMANIAFRQGIFSKEAKDSSKALFAADSGLECVNVWDISNMFELMPDDVNITCVESFGSFNMRKDDNGDGSFTYESGLVPASADQSLCMNVSITKNIFAYNDENGQPVFATRLDSKGYNKSCSTTSDILDANTENNLLVERRLSNTYTRGS